jgi:uncharacterized protein (DUF427 family)
MSRPASRIPGPDHPISIKPTPGRVVVRMGGRVIADTRSALTLKEASYPGVQYVPRQDVDMSLLERSSHSTHCPYKGDAGYYSLAVDGTQVPNAVWTYEAPAPAVAAIKDHLAFYPERVDGIEIGG